MGLVDRDALCLPHHLAVPVDAERGELFKLCVSRSLVAGAVKVFDAHHECSAGAPCTEPSQ